MSACTRILDPFLERKCHAMTSIAEYRQMLRIRLLEENMMRLKGAGEVPGSIHLCIGQEAIPVGTARSLRTDDYVTATYRGHGWAIVAGAAPAEILAEVMGRVSSLNGGRGASPYLSDAEHNFIGENSIVGAGVPIACGAALTAKREKKGRVSVVSIGDGATNQGAVHESLNMAAVLQLPVVFIVENNVYSEMSPISEMVRIDRLARRGDGYGIPAVTVDGNDVSAVASGVGDAVARARMGGGPTFVEATTQRLVGHYSGDVQHYRPPGELDRAREDEPLARIRRAADAELAAQLREVDLEVEQEIALAVTTARSSPFPSPETVLEHVYV